MGAVVSGEPRPIQSPYLVTNGTDHHGVAVSVMADASTTVVEMRVRGRWSPEIGSQVATNLRLCLAGPPTSIIVDLHGLDDFHGVSRRFWLAAGQAGERRSTPARLSLCLPADTMLAFRLRRLDGHQRFVFATMSEARAAVAGRHSRLQRIQIRLAPEPSAVAAARDLVERACYAWKLPDLCREDALSIMSELAGNAVEHARTEFVATVSLEGEALHLAVRDGATEYPRLHEPRPARMSGGGRGLLLIHAMAVAWGAMPARRGKVVWATVGTGSETRAAIV
jgi:anti-sigma regulatory factor (Ser/Thr protein kinase)